MNWLMFAGALLVFGGGVITTLPHGRAAMARRTAGWWRKAAKDREVGELREVLDRISRDIEREAGATMGEWLLMVVGVALGLTGALLMSFATA